MSPTPAEVRGNPERENLDHIPSARDDVYFHLMENDTLDEAKIPMAEKIAERIRIRVDAVYRAESRRVFATLIRRLGDFDLAEEALHDAFRAALEQWPRDGEPANPRAWLTSVGRFKAIDRIRRRARFDPLDDAASGPVIASIDDFSGKPPISAKVRRLPSPGSYTSRESIATR
jgi:hypothetical protein